MSPAGGDDRAVLVLQFALPDAFPLAGEVWGERAEKEALLRGWGCVYDLKRRGVIRWWRTAKCTDQVRLEKEAGIRVGGNVKP